MPKKEKREKVVVPFQKLPADDNRKRNIYKVKMEGSKEYLVHNTVR